MSTDRSKRVGIERYFLNQADASIAELEPHLETEYIDDNMGE